MFRGRSFHYLSLNLPMFPRRATLRYRIRYYSEVKKKTLIAFVDPIPVVHESADDLYQTNITLPKLNLIWWTMLATLAMVLR